MGRSVHRLVNRLAMLPFFLRSWKNLRFSLFFPLPSTNNRRACVMVKIGNWNLSDEKWDATKMQRRTEQNIHTTPEEMIIGVVSAVCFVYLFRVCLYVLLTDDTAWIGACVVHTPIRRGAVQSLLRTIAVSMLFLFSFFFPPNGTI